MVVLGVVLLSSLACAAPGVNIIFRRGASSDWTAANPVLQNGEPGYETDTGLLKIGDGLDAWQALTYSSSFKNYTGHNVNYAVNTTGGYSGQSVVTPEQYGAKGDGITDDTAAILAAYNASNNVVFGAKTYAFATAPKFPPKTISLEGKGSRQTIFLYKGSNTSTDCFTFGNYTTESNGVRISGIGFSSYTTMRAGAGVHFKLLTRSDLKDVLFDHQDGNGKFYHGVWFDGVDASSLDHYQARGQGDAFRVNGAQGSASVGARADLFVTNGKISGSGVGLHIGGAFGGFRMDNTDVIANAKNLLIDKMLNAYGNNREIFFGSGVSFDSAGTTAAPYSGTNIDIEDTGGFIFFDDCWNASASTLMKIGSSFTGFIKWTGGFLFNAFNSYGGKGNAVEINNINTALEMKGTRFQFINGTAIKSMSGTNTASTITNPVFNSDVFKQYSGMTLLPTSAPQRLVVGGTSSFNSAVDGNPAATIYLGMNYGGAVALGYYANNPSNGWLDFNKSRGATPGAHGLVLGNDVLGGINFAGSDGTNFISAARIRSVAIGTPASGSLTGRMVFSTRQTTGNLIDWIALTENGNWIPVTDNTISLGASGDRWNNVWTNLLTATVVKQVSGTSTNHTVCWKSDGSLGYCSQVVDSSGVCGTCN
jgi:hypothetical protein